MVLRVFVLNIMGIVNVVAELIGNNRGRLWNWSPILCCFSVHYYSPLGYGIAVQYSRTHDGQGVVSYTLRLNRLE